MFVILALTYALSALPSALASCEPISDVTLTFYGWPDNSPPGSDNAFDCGRGTNPDGEPKAGGTGTYDDPISFATATDNNNLPRCAIVYVPLLRKYFRNEDDCAQCGSDWDSKKEYHIDLWTGSNTAGGGQSQLDCEDNLPGGPSTIILDPPRSLPVDPTPLYNLPTNQCHTTSYTIPLPSTLCVSAISESPSPPPTPPTSSPTLPPSQPAAFPAPHANATVPPTTHPAPLSSTLTSSSSSSSRAPASEEPCPWKGHCVGDACRTSNDCFGTDVCVSRRCEPL
ncbi:hypothetical protein BDR22DRAFT_939914 [Usnea florida]